MSPSTSISWRVRTKAAAQTWQQGACSGGQAAATSPGGAQWPQTGTAFSTRRSHRADGRQGEADENTKSANKDQTEHSKGPPITPVSDEDSGGHPALLQSLLCARLRNKPRLQWGKAAKAEDCDFTDTPPSFPHR